ncbi:MAG: N-acetylmuramoyl-L-alanine amidase [Firmicutes bacterium]|nr:N-acetylmuramoyl-L-alanine amidase [Bacillota bacterium]
MRRIQMRIAGVTVACLAALFAWVLHLPDTAQGSARAPLPQQSRPPAQTPTPKGPLPLSGTVIVIDPGHGGVDPGAVGIDQVLEKDLALQLSQRLKRLLQSGGAQVWLTRTGDYDLADPKTKGYSRRKRQDLPRRVRFAKAHNTDLFVSIHLDSFGRQTAWQGGHVLYNPNRPEARRLALLIQDELNRQLDGKKRAIPRRDLLVLNAQTIPAVLVEAGFLSNPQEVRLLQTPAYQEQIAACLYRGIVRFYLGETLP